MLVQQLAQALKNQNVQKLEVGAALSARIAEVMNGALTLDIGDGNRLTARELSGRDFQAGQNVVFEVVGFDEGGIPQLRVTGSEQELAPESLDVGPLLKKLNLADTEGNREMLRILSAYRVPLTQQNIRAAQDLSMQAKGIVQLADQGGDFLTDFEPDTLKEIAIRLIETVGSPDKETALPRSVDNKTLMASGAGDTNVLKDVKTPISDAEVKGKAPADSILDPKNILFEHKERAGELKSSGLNTNESKFPMGDPAKGLNSEIEDPSRETELKTLLKQVTLEKIGFVIKNQLPHDINTFSAIDRLLLGKKDLDFQLRELAGKIPDDADVSLKELIQNIGKSLRISPEMNPFELQKELKTLNHSLTSISAQIADTTSETAGVRTALADVKNSLDFLGRLNENATYLHVPVVLGQGTKTMDLYVQRDKSGQKKVNPKDTRIFISLETNHMETVQCLVEVKEKRLDIGFKLADAETLSFISGVFAPLKESLIGLGYTDVMVHGVLYPKPLNLMDITQEPSSDLRRIDMRV